MKNLIKVLLFILLIGLFSCEYEESGVYTLTVDGYLGNFTGYYYIDGKFEGSFTGTTDAVDHYYYEKSINTLISIKIYAFKDAKESTLTVTIWKDSKEVKTTTLVANALDAGGGEMLAIDPLYYEAEEDTESGT